MPFKVTNPVANMTEDALTRAASVNKGVFDMTVEDVYKRQVLPHSSTTLTTMLQVSVVAGAVTLAIGVSVISFVKSAALMFKYFLACLLYTSYPCRPCTGPLLRRFRRF